jgi:hypothetical protein
MSFPPPNPAGSIAPWQTDNRPSALQAAPTQSPLPSAYSIAYIPQFTPTRPGPPPPPVYVAHHMPFGPSVPPPPGVFIHHVSVPTQPSVVVPRQYVPDVRDPRFPATYDPTAGARMRLAATGGTQENAPMVAQAAAAALGGLRTSVVFPTSHITPSAGDDEWTRVRVTQRRQEINVGTPAAPRPLPTAVEPVAEPVVPVIESVVPVADPVMPVIEPESDPEPEPEIEAVVDESAPGALGSGSSDSSFDVEAVEKVAVLPSPSAAKRTRPRAQHAAPDAEAYDAAIAAVLGAADGGRPRRERRVPARFIPGEKR